MNVAAQHGQMVVICWILYINVLRIHMISQNLGIAAKPHSGMYQLCSCMVARRMAQKTCW